MKSRLITRYYELREARQWTKLGVGSILPDPTGLDTSLITLRMMRIDHILFMRYGYDITLTHQLN